MASKIPNEGEIRMLEKALVNNMEIRLFVNDMTPGDADSIADYVEMSTHGYTAKALTGGSWAVAAAGGKAEGSYAQQVWTFIADSVGAMLVYGYFIVDTLDDTIIQAERFGAPASVELEDDKIRITPKITLSSEA